MTRVTLTLHEDPSTFMISLLESFYYFEIPNNFCEEFEIILYAQSVF
jgi:hypothetical protein